VSAGLGFRPRVPIGLLALALFLLAFGPARRLAQMRGWRIGRRTPVWFHRLVGVVVGMRVRSHRADVDALAERVAYSAPIAAETGSATASTLVVANHVSWLDIPVLGTCEPLTFLAKKEVGGPFLGRQVALLQGVVFVDRKRRRAIPKVNADMIRAMRARERVVLFAEATTGDGNRLLRFRSSHFEAIARVGGEAFIQPVYLNYSRIAGMPVGRIERPNIAWYGDMDFLPHLRRLLRSGGLVCDVYWGEPIPVGPGADRKALARATEAAVRRLAGLARDRSTSPVHAARETS
jgi:1-acyl-sn-glycerol-3-phosphate acyltransferase